MNLLQTTSLKDSITLYDLLKRPEISIENIQIFKELSYSKDVLKEVEIKVKYEGYINKATKEAQKLINLENKKIPEDIDYNYIPNLAS